MQLMAENSYKLIDMQQGQLRYLASATCSVGTEKHVLVASHTIKILIKPTLYKRALVELIVLISIKHH